MTQEVLDRLKQLQTILSEKFVVEKELKEIPKSLNTKVEVVNRLKKTYIERNQQYDEGKQKIVDLKEQISQAEKDREHSEALIVEISTQREYEALLKQIKEATDREQQFRRDLQREEKIVEDLSQLLLRDELTIATQEEELKQEQAVIKSQIDTRQVKAGNLQKSELELTNDGLLSKDILFKFERIITKKEGIGIVPLSKGVCTGCNMILPLQFVNEVRSNRDDQPHFCPYCSMILYHEDSDEVYYDFVYDESMLFHTEDDDDVEDEEMDEARLMEAEMNEGYLDDDDDEAGDDLVEDEETVVVDDDDDDDDDIDSDGEVSEEDGIEADEIDDAHDDPLSSDDDEDEVVEDEIE